MGSCGGHGTGPMQRRDATHTQACMHTHAATVTLRQSCMSMPKCSRHEPRCQHQHHAMPCRRTAAPNGAAQTEAGKWTTDCAQRHHPGPRMPHLKMLASPHPCRARRPGAHPEGAAVVGPRLLSSADDAGLAVPRAQRRRQQRLQPRTHTGGRKMQSVRACVHACACAAATVLGTLQRPAHAAGMGMANGS